MRKLGSILSGIVFALLLVGPGTAGAAEKENGRSKESIDPSSIERLENRMGGRARVSVSKATGAVRFVAIEPGETGDLMAGSRGELREKVSAFMNEYAGMFGIRDVAGELELGRAESDEFGGRHLSYYQVYRGVPVFAGILRAHFDDAGALTAINGNVIPDVELNITPTHAATDAAASAIAVVRKDNDGREISARSGVLLVYRTGLAQGVPGTNHLAWQVEVGNDADIREFVYVDAHSGKIVDRLPGIIDALSRRAYDGQFLPAVPPSYPGSPFWVEGNPFPTGNAEADNMITSSKETYDFYGKAFGRDSFDGAGAVMDSIFNRGYQCPNASWNGTFISFCNGLTTDDVTAHEWTHAYTQYTHGLIYQWQSGALNEAYSDIFGETVDRINGRDTVGNSATDPLRISACTVNTTMPPVITINAPPAIAGPKVAGTAAFGPQSFTFTQDVVVVNDGVGNAAPPTGAPGDLSVIDGCETPFVNAAAVAGKIALMYRGTCGFAVKAKNAQLNGALGVIIANHAIGGNAAPGMAGVDATIVIPSLSLGNANGEAVRLQAASATVNATLTRGVLGTENSTRWLLGEDDTAVGLNGALRDMFNPNCYANPGKVSDTTYYVCGPGTAANDNGGVHSNSGVPNHAYALIVDGGTYNGRTVNGIGLTKAAHIYYRAMTVYQNAATDFDDHADAIERSTWDLLGKNLKDLTTGNPSGQRITLGDLLQVKKAMAAVEMRKVPQCTFAPPLLAQNPPALCPSGLPFPLFIDGFDIPAISNAIWSVSHEGTTADFTQRDWDIVGNLPDGRILKAFLGSDPDIGTCAPGGDETAVLHLQSPRITIPSGVVNPRLTFVHWVATEAGWDGGNVKISVNDGPWQLVQPADFIYNPYNTTLFTVADGNSNPLAGEPAFSGTDDGSTGGSWGRSIVNLAPYAHAQDKVRIRFDIGNDGCGGRLGWFIDEFFVYKCR